MSGALRSVWNHSPRRQRAATRTSGFASHTAGTPLVVLLDVAGREHELLPLSVHVISPPLTFYGRCGVLGSRLVL